MLPMGSLFQQRSDESQPGSLSQERPIAIGVAGTLWVFLAAMLFLPALAFVASEAGPLWLLSVVVIPAMPLTLFALVVSKPTRRRLRLSLVAGVFLTMFGGFLAVPQSVDASPSAGQAILLVGLGIVLSSAVALRRRVLI